MAKERQSPSPDDTLNSTSSSPLSRYEEILALVDPHASREEIMRRLAAFERRSAENVRQAVPNFVARVNALLAAGADAATEEANRLRGLSPRAKSPRRRRKERN